MSGHIPREFIQDLLARTDIVEIISTRVPLKKRGQNYLACCPFHTEKTPSFTVSSSKQFYYCFGCSQSGNTVGFLMAYDRMEFVDAIEYLANQHGLDIPRDKSNTNYQQHDKLYPILDEVTTYYEQQLRQSQAAINYLKGRGLTGQTAKAFRIGFAPSEWENLSAQFKEPEQQTQLTTHGLIIHKEQRHFDRFRSRIMFPIRDVRGRIIAFGGRTLGDEQPKYMNSPETPIFHKNNELYGLFEARQQNHNLTSALVVEGYMDVVALSQFGISYAVATLGTAINAKHVHKLLRFTKDIVFCFDGDEAGQRAGMKALTISLPLLREGIHIRFLFLPEGEDPDSLVAKIGKEAFLQKIKMAAPLSEVFFQYLTKKITPVDLDSKADFAKQASEYLNAMPHGLYRKLMYDQLATILQVEQADLERLLNAQPINQDRTLSTKATPTLTVGRQLTPTQLALVLLLKKPELATTVEDTSHLFAINTTDIKLLVQLINGFKQDQSRNIGQLLQSWENDELKQYIATLAAYELAIPEDGWSAEFQDAFNYIKQNYNKHRAQQLITKGKQAPLTQAEKEYLQGLLARNAGVEED